MNSVVTKAFIKDEDINIARIKSLIDDISAKIKTANSFNLTDINVISEEIFGNLINLLYGYHLKSMSATVSGNFAAVDLIDSDNKVAYQITSRTDRKKMMDTLDRFEREILSQQISKIYILVLGNESHNFNSPTIRMLNNGQIFNLKEDVINLYGLLDIIEEKAKTQPDLLIHVYDILMMIYDSGRLEYLDIVKETKQLAMNCQIDVKEYSFVKTGMGDICVRAFLPSSYDKEISCCVEIRKHDIRGAQITINQDDLINNYFVDEEDFQKKHLIGGNTEDGQIWFDMGHIRLEINAHSAYHLFLIFASISEKYKEKMEKICNNLGCSKLRVIKGEFVVGHITPRQREDILLFAKEHNWGLEIGEIKWNIFNNCCIQNKIVLSPNLSTKDKGQILATFEFKPVIINNEISEYIVLWKPGEYTEATGGKFDNVTRWTGDYAMEWFELLLKKLNEQNAIELSHKSKSFTTYLKRLLGL